MLSLIVSMLIFILWMALAKWRFGNHGFVAGEAKSIYTLNAIEQFLLMSGNPLLYIHRQFISRYARGIVGRGIASAIGQGITSLMSRFRVVVIAPIKMGYRAEEQEKMILAYSYSFFSLALGSIMCWLPMIMIKMSYEALLVLTVVLAIVPFYPLLRLLQHYKASVHLFDKEFVIMIQHLAVMSGIGMHPQQAYKQWCQVKHSRIMDLMLEHTNREMLRGLTFFECWLVWQEIVPHNNVKRFVALMAQSTRHGMTDLSVQLWRIVEDVTVFTKLETRRKAEGISSKLLMPMMVSLVALLMLLTYPAIAQLNGFN